jgi:hypothetical protein
VFPSSLFFYVYTDDYVVMPDNSSIIFHLLYIINSGILLLPVWYIFSFNGCYEQSRQEFLHGGSQTVAFNTEEPTETRSGNTESVWNSITRPWTYGYQTTVDVGLSKNCNFDSKS